MTSFQSLIKATYYTRSFSRISCNTKMSSKKLDFPATQRNKVPILEILRETIKEKFSKGQHCHILEIASGSGQHAVYFAENLSNLTWQPTDIDDHNLASIEAYVKEAGLNNLNPPIKVDISENIEDWANELKSKKFDLIMCANLIHISPWKCTEGLFRAASSLLNPKGILLTYGPYARHGKITPQSNVSFNESLKSRNPEWGLRDTDDLLKEAEKNQLLFDTIHDMPSNNHSIVYVYQGI